MMIILHTWRVPTSDSEPYTAEAQSDSWPRLMVAGADPDHRPAQGVRPPPGYRGGRQSHVDSLRLPGIVTERSPIRDGQHGPRGVVVWERGSGCAYLC